jgi:hypothetical protein
MRPACYSIMSYHVTMLPCYAGWLVRLLGGLCQQPTQQPFVRLALDGSQAAHSSGSDGIQNWLMSGSLCDPMCAGLPGCKGRGAFTAAV